CGHLLSSRVRGAPRGHAPPSAVSGLGSMFLAVCVRSVTGVLRACPLHRSTTRGKRGIPCSAPENSLHGRKNSLFRCSGISPRRACLLRIFSVEATRPSAFLESFPDNFPVCREFALECTLRLKHKTGNMLRCSPGAYVMTTGAYGAPPTRVV